MTMGLGGYRDASLGDALLILKGPNHDPKQVSPHLNRLLPSLWDPVNTFLRQGKSFVEEDDKVSVSFFQKLLEKQMKGLKLEGVHPTDPCQKLLLKYDQPHFEQTLLPKDPLLSCQNFDQC